jgi:hypothetical protein
MPSKYVKKVPPTCKPLHDRPPVVKRVCYQSGTKLPKFMSELKSLSLDYFNWFKPLSSQNASNENDPRTYTQREEKWFNARKCKIIGNKAINPVGHEI